MASPVTCQAWGNTYWLRQAEDQWHGLDGTLSVKQSAGTAISTRFAWAVYRIMKLKEWTDFNLISKTGLPENLGHSRGCQQQTQPRPYPRS